MTSWIMQTWWPHKVCWPITYLFYVSMCAKLALLYDERLNSSNFGFAQPLVAKCWDCIFVANFAFEKMLTFWMIRKGCNSLYTCQNGETIMEGSLGIGNLHYPWLNEHWMNSAITWFRWSHQRPLTSAQACANITTIKVYEDYSAAIKRHAPLPLFQLDLFKVTSSKLHVQLETISDVESTICIITTTSLVCAMWLVVSLSHVKL